MNDSMFELIRCCLLPNRIPSNHFMFLTVFLRLNDTPDQNSKDQRLTRTIIYLKKNNLLLLKSTNGKCSSCPFKTSLRVESNAKLQWDEYGSGVI